MPVACLLIFLVPTRVVRRQAHSLAEILDRLREAEGALSAANRGLSERVTAGVREIRELSARVVAVQEHERRRIARDLHDSVGQSLTALLLELELARGRADAAAHVAEAERLCGATLEELRRVVHDLRPPELESGALGEILRATTERFEERTGVAVSFRCPAGLAAPAPVATCLLRVLQEALTNVSRHARAHEVGVSLALADGAVTMVIADDGAGADPAATPAGSGISGMRERCALLGGVATVELRPGHGTRVAVRLPLAPPAGATEAA